MEFPDIDHRHHDYRPEELLELGQQNAQALLLSASLAIGDDEDVLGVWIEGIAEVLLRGWDTEQEWSVGELMDALTTNYRTYGGTIISQEIGDSLAVAIVADIPDLALAEALGATDAEGDVLFRIGEHIVAGLGHTMHWERDPETGDVRIIVS